MSSENYKDCNSSININNDIIGIKKIVRDIHKDNKNEKDGIRELREIYGHRVMSKKCAENIMHDEYSGNDTTNSINDFLISRGAELIMRTEPIEHESPFSNFVSDYKKETSCPRCGSTSISYDTKKLSVGRGIAGGLIGGAAGGALGEAVGMTVGSLSSKKGYCVCLNCGKRWKI